MSTENRQPPTGLRWEKARDAVDTGRCVDLTTAMIQCDTRNPPGNETLILPLLRDVMRGLGATVEVFEPAPGRPSLLARCGPCDGSRPILLINGHVDVVPVDEAEWSVPPFAGVVRGDNLMGRGACDMKGGIAAAIEGLRACRDAGVEPPADLVFHLVADEETGGAFGTAALLAAGRIAADAAVVPEPSELGIGIAERGTLFARIEVFGRAGHGSDPAAARSAVADAARITQALHAGALPRRRASVAGPAQLQRRGGPRRERSQHRGGVLRTADRPARPARADLRPGRRDRCGR